MRTVRVLIGLAALATLAAAPAAQSRVAIKLATFVPEGSVWGRNLNQMRADWAKSTGGRVALTIFPGGSQGDDVKVLQKMRLDALQAAALVTGLSQIDDAFNVFSIPFFFESPEELAHVLEKLTPTLEQRLTAHGYVLLNWGYGGWAHVFTTRPVSTIDDIKKTPLFTSAGNDRMVELYKQLGFEPRALALTDIPTGLKTGMIEALPTTPLAAMTLQWYSDVPHMIDLGIAPLVGGTVITAKAWYRVPEADRARLLESAGAVGRRLLAEVPKQDEGAVEQMKARGLKVVPVDQQSPEWKTTSAAFISGMRGTLVPDDVLDLATRERDSYRKSRGGARSR